MICSFLAIPVLASDTLVTVESDVIVDYTYGGYPYQRSECFAVTRFWVFYTDGTNLCFKTSLDGVTFGSKVTVQSGGVDCALDDMRKFCLWLNGSATLHYCRVSTNLMYRRGTLVSDGTITWTSNEVTAVSGTVYYPTVCCDTSGYPFVSYMTTAYRPYVDKSSTNDGSWVDDSVNNFPYNLNSLHYYCHPALVQLASGHMLAVWMASSGMRQKSYDGAGTWNSMKSITAGYSTTINYFSVVAESGGDIAHIIFPNATTYAFYEYTYTYSTNTVSVLSIVEDTQVGITVCPVWSIDFATNYRYLFWSRSSTQHIYYKFWNSSWQATEDWLDDSTNGIANADTVDCAYEVRSYFVGIGWLGDASAPYDVRFCFRNLTPIPIGTAYENVVNELCGLYDSLFRFASFQRTNLETLQIPDTLLAFRNMETLLAEIFLSYDSVSSELGVYVSVNYPQLLVGVFLVFGLVAFAIWQATEKQ